MRIIGFDIHRAFVEAITWEDGKLRRLGRVDMRRNLLTASPRPCHGKISSSSRRPATLRRSRA
jgi:hypothetical protein